MGVGGQKITLSFKFNLSTCSAWIPLLLFLFHDKCMTLWAPVPHHVQPLLFLIVSPLPFKHPESATGSHYITFTLILHSPMNLWISPTTPPDWSQIRLEFAVTNGVNSSKDRLEEPANTSKMLLTGTRFLSRWFSDVYSQRECRRRKTMAASRRKPGREYDMNKTRHCVK